MDLMIPNQANKDVVFNESLLVIDNFLNLTINGFSDIIPDNLKSGEKYIITNGEHKDHICYKTHESKNIEYFIPSPGTLFFLIETHDFMLYNGNDWEKIQF